MKKLKSRTNKGITLIALVITIIVLLILAGISIATLTGENGILTQAQNAKEQTEIANEKEIIEIAAVGAMEEDNWGYVTKDNLKTELDKQISGKYSMPEGDEIIVTYNDSKRSYLVDSNGNVTEYKTPVDQPEKGGTPFIRTVGTTDIVFLTGTSYNEGEANAPLLDSNTMIPIKHNGTNWVVTTADDPDWYNYDTEERKWANVMLTDGKYKVGDLKAGDVVAEDDLGSMFVWIPRYAYKIAYFNSEDDKKAYVENRSDKSKIIGYSDARGIVDTEGKVPSNIKEDQVTSIAVGDNYRPHPVFEEDVTKGGWGQKTTGIWVGKFETTEALDGSGKNVILPNKEVHLNINLSEMFNRCQNMETSLNMNLDSHLMKNMEWGATAYLTESQYGRNGTEINVNHCWDYITGAGYEKEGSYIGSPKEEQKYNGNIGMLASTTGNIYGIYDMSGGANDYVMAFYQDENGNIHTGKSTTMNSGFNGYLSDGTQKTDGVDLPDRKYYEVYLNEDNSNNIGNALFETSNWNDDDYYLGNLDSPILSRGGVSTLVEERWMGVFSCRSGRGKGIAIDGSRSSFHICLAVK